MLIREQSISNKKPLSIGPIGFLNIPKLFNQGFLLERLWWF